MYDGITGLVTQPLRGAKKSGAEGFIKGFGKGIAGLVAKPGAGIYGIPAYTMKGVYQEIQKRFGASVQNYIIASRTAQGYSEYQSTTREQRKEVATKYLEIQYESQKKKAKVDEQVEMIQQRWSDRRERRRQEKERSAISKGKQRAKSQTSTWSNDMQSFTAELSQRYQPASREGSMSDLPLEQSASSPLPPSHIAELSAEDLSASGRPKMGHAATFPRGHPAHDEDQPLQVQHREHYQDLSEDDDELEAAIRASIAQTSRGNENEDDLIAKAIRASLAALENEQRKSADDEEALSRAVTASVNEASKHIPEGVNEEEYHKMLEQVLKQSVLDQRSAAPARSSIRRMRSSDSEWDDSSDDYASTDHDENFHKALEDSALTPYPTRVDANDEAEEEELKKALEASTLTPGPRTDAEMEEEMRKAVEASKLTPAPTRTEEDEEAELAKAMEESKRTNTEPQEADDFEEQLQKAMEESMGAAEKNQEAEAKRQREEDVIMKYVQKQSMMEEEARKKRLQGFEPEEKLGESSKGPQSSGS